jgi:D-sedoheptulose 7-phosphate isomerase
MVAVLRIQNIGLADVCICVPATQTPHVQEFHLPIYNCLSLMLEETFVSHWQ